MPPCWTAVEAGMVDKTHSAAALLAALEDEDAGVEASLRPTAEEERAVMTATRQQAFEHGVNAKAGGEHGWVGSMRRKFERYLEKHGAATGYDAVAGIDDSAQGLGIVRDFMDYCFSGLGREQLFSGCGRKGFADEYFSLHLPYALAQKVFPIMGMPGWVGLEKHELQACSVGSNSRRVQCAGCACVMAVHVCCRAGMADCARSWRIELCRRRRHRSSRQSRVTGSS